MQNDSHVHVDNGARSEEYKNILTQIQKDAVCPFCTEHLKKYHKNPILKESDFWIVTTNMYPYENTSHHILFIVRRHIINTKDLTKEEWSELQTLTQWVMDELNITNGTFMLRSGDMSKTGASVKHLHAQFVVGSDPHKPVITRVG